MHIGELQRVTDITDGERAMPEQRTTYGLRSIDNIAVETHVEFVVRHGQRLIARGTCGNEFPVSGPGAFVLVPRSR
jgi:translation elongation factor EF-Tu-like GTPase